MLGLAALLIAAAPPARDGGPGAFDARLRASAAAAQALQGPLDGTWTLYDSHGRALYVFQITDPAGGAGPLDAAWREPGQGTPMGLAMDIARQGGDLTIRFVPPGGASNATLRLTRRGPRDWVGWIIQDGRRRTARLTLTRRM